MTAMMEDFHRGYLSGKIETLIPLTGAVCSIAFTTLRGARNVAPLQGEAHTMLMEAKRLEEAAKALRDAAALAEPRLRLVAAE